MSNYWINVMDSTHSVTFSLSIAVGIISAFLTIFLSIGHELLGQHVKLFAKIVIGLLATFVFLILAYIFTSPIN